MGEYLEREELKPCPFCGGMADIRVVAYHRDGGDIIVIKCATCGASTKTYSYDNKEKAIKAWNIRSYRG